MINLDEFKESVRGSINIITLLYTDAFKREMERFVHPTGPVSKQIACDNVITMINELSERKICA